jgi:hypothetical protein
MPIAYLGAQAARLLVFVYPFTQQAGRLRSQIGN